MPWLLNEDEAMLRRLQGIRLPGDDREIQTRFAFPEPETPELTYPSIVIERARAARASDREHRGTANITYGPEGGELPASDDRWGWYAEFPIPYNIDYSVVCQMRYQAQQVALAGLLATELYLPERGGWLSIPQRGVAVSMDIVGGPEFNASVDNDGKRIFEIHYLVRVCSELTPWEIQRLTFPDHVGGTIYNREGTNLMATFDETT